MPHAVHVIIPARLASSRFPRKVLAAATGKPLIQHVWERARLSTCATSVLIAADDEEVAGVARGFGARVVLTSVSHPNGSSRLAEAAQLIGAADDDYVVNVQGDEPELDPALIDATYHAAVRTGADSATAACPIVSDEEHNNPNVVKVVVGVTGCALYFSRSPLPHARIGGDNSAPRLRHIGLYVYKAGFLKRYVTLPSTPLERTEVLEQLRILEHGYSMAVHQHTPNIPPEKAASGYGTGIDTPEQYAAFVKRYAAGIR
jgi:3-deoxy-manno-octulosonate cytidylyltransferase (CMP-KDO synthetase)